MSEKRIAELSAQKVGLLQSMTSLVTRGMTDSDQYRKLDEEVKSLEETINMLRKLDSMMSPQQRADANNEAIQAAVQASAAETRQSVVSAITSLNSGNGAEVRKAKVYSALRTEFQRGNRASEEVRDILTTGDGASLVQQLYSDSIARAAAYVSPIANLVKTVDIKAGQPIKNAVSDDTGRIMTAITEGTTDTSTLATDPVLFSQIKNDSDTLVTTELVSWQAIDDIQDLTQFIQQNAGEVIARTVSKAILTGKDGANNALVNHTTGGLIATSPVGATATALNALSYADITNLFASVNQQYFNEGSLLVASSTYQYLLAQVSSTGKALYKVGNDGILRIAGRPVYAASELAPLSTASGIIGLFGAFSRAWMYGQGETGIQVIRERYAEQMIAEVIIHHRMSGASLVTTAVKALKNHS